MYSCSASEIFCKNIYIHVWVKHVQGEGGDSASLLYLAQNNDCILYHKTFVINHQS